MDDRLLWYVTRGSGAVALILLSAVMVLGVMTRMHVEGARWPRFLTAALHRDLSLTAACFLVLHIVTAVVDPFTHLGIVAATVPFGSYYRTLWLGLGTVTLELGVAVLITSLIRRFIGQRVWRAVHWLAYASWPLAVLHSIGTGTDTVSLWMLCLDLVCVGGVAAAVMWRVRRAPHDPVRELRRAALRRVSLVGAR